MSKEQIKALLDQFEAKGKKRQELLGKGDGFTAADLDEVKKLNTEQEGIKARIDALKAGAELDDWAGKASPRLDIPTQADQQGIKGNILGWNPSPKDAEVGPITSFFNVKEALLQEVGQTKANKLWETSYRTAYFKALRGQELGLTERKDLEEGLDPQGGYFVPVELLNRIIQRQATPTRLGGMVTGVGASGNAIEMPTVEGGDDTYPTPVRVKWVGEKTSASSHRVSDTDLFGKRRIDIHQLMMSIPLTLSMLEDSSFDLEAWVASKFVEATDLETDRAILLGSGAGQPMGIITRAINGDNGPTDVITGDAALLTTDGILNLTEDLPEQYDERAVAIYAKTKAGKAIRTLKDTTGQPIFVNGYQDKGYAGPRQRTLNGYPVVWSGFMPSVAAGNRPILFGDPSAYVLARRVAFSLQVLREKYAEDGYIVLLGRSRMGGDLVEPWRMRSQKVSAS